MAKFFRAFLIFMILKQNFFLTKSYGKIFSEENLRFYLRHLINNEKCGIFNRL
jgi:hypothetical protein